MELTFRAEREDATLSRLDDERVCDGVDASEDEERTNEPRFDVAGELSSDELITGVVVVRDRLVSLS
jgi:hypothetical protein